MAHHVYIVVCADGTLYTGYAKEVERRVAEHNEGKGARYTRGRTPVELVHTETFQTRSAAMSREHEIKRWPRSKKLGLIAQG